MPQRPAHEIEFLRTHRVGDAEDIAGVALHPVTARRGDLASAGPRRSIAMTWRADEARCSAIDENAVRFADRPGTHSDSGVPGAPQRRARMRPDGNVMSKSIPGNLRRGP